VSERAALVTRPDLRNSVLVDAANPRSGPCRSLDYPMDVGKESIALLITT
jgi:hypothetical protein